MLRGRAPVKLGVGRKRNRPPDTLRRRSRGEGIAMGKDYSIYVGAVG